jgi:hypothetical protein
MPLMYSSTVHLGLADTRSLTERWIVNAQVDLNTGNCVDAYSYYRQCPWPFASEK